jgi:transcriptional regulator with XRE-family HTH domain
MTGRKRVAWNIRRLRVAKGVSQEDLAYEAGIDRAYFGRVERALENPTLDLLDKIAGALTVDLSALLLAPKSGEAPPKALKAGRRPAQRAKRLGR